MIIYGSNATKIGEFNIGSSKCDYCENTGTQHISVFGKYAHIYWIPFFPVGKKAVAECFHCKRTIEQSEFPSDLFSKYQEAKSQVRRPVWHWTGVGLIAALVIWFNIMSATTEVDPRSKLFDADRERITTSPTMESDSLAYKLKSFFKDFTNEQINPDEFGFFTKVSVDKVLILAKIPELKHVQKEGREQVIDMIELITNATASTKDKKKYIGVEGKITMMMVKTPTTFENELVASQDPLYDFYGSKPAKKKGKK